MSGCTAVLVDLPLVGLRVARRRALRDGLRRRCTVLAANATALPFADGSFDRIHHADVLCCLEPKRQTLCECGRVARPGARMEFSVIWLARKPASDAEHALLQRSGPPFPDAGAGYTRLLDDAGWKLCERIDVSAEFAHCLDAQQQQSEARRSELLALLGDRDYAARTDRRRSTLAALEAGLLRREIFVAAIAAPVRAPSLACAAS